MEAVPFRVFATCVMRYYVIPELLVNVLLLLNLADMLGRCLTPIVIQVCIRVEFLLMCLSF